MNEPPKLTGRLVNAKQLLELLWEPESRPSLRWLRYRIKAKAIPIIRIGRLVYFDPDMVRTSLAKRNVIQLRRSSENT